MREKKNCKSYITYNWPSKFYEEGFNWLAIYNEKKIINKLNKVYKLSDKWKNKYRKQYSFIMPIDTHNQKLRKVIKKLFNMKYCKNCIMPNTRPDQIFDENGVCNACLSFLRNKNINWNKRFEEFNEIVKEVKSFK